MKGAVLYGPRDIRFEDRETPKIVEPTDAVVRITVTCVCGSDLWPYRALQPIDGPTPMGHEYCGIVEEVGGAVTSVRPGQFVVGSFATSDNTCPHCLYGYQSSCVHREFISRAQAPVLRVPLANGTLVATPTAPSKDLLPSVLTTSDVLGTGWLPPMRPMCRGDQRWQLSATARSACSASSRPSRWAPSGSLP
jgi:threonine dehydrogenase-like Zn-dependent dehydrogenase